MYEEAGIPDCHPLRQQQASSAVGHANPVGKQFVCGPSGDQQVINLEFFPPYLYIHLDILVIVFVCFIAMATSQSKPGADPDMSLPSTMLDPNR